MNRAVVALETSGRAPSVAVRCGERSASADLESERAHASDLLPTVDRLLREVGARPSGIDAVLVGTGPGSYTGLRVGIATALGIARGCDARLRGVPSGETLCWAELRAGEEGTVLLDARAGEIYLARYLRTDDEVDILRAPCVLRPAEVGAEVARGGPIFGDAEALVASNLLPGAGARFREGARPVARALLELGAKRLERLGPVPPADVAPLYLRPFAVRTRRR